QPLLAGMRGRLLSRDLPVPAPLELHPTADRRRALLRTTLTARTRRQVVASSWTMADIVVRARASSSVPTVTPPTPARPPPPAAARPPPPNRAPSAPISCRRRCWVHGLTPTEILMFWLCCVPDTAYRQLG